MTIREAAHAFYITEVAVWKLIQNKRIGSTVERRTRQVHVSHSELSKLFTLHPSVLASLRERPKS